MNSDREHGDGEAPPASIPTVGELQNLVSELIMAVSEAKAIPASGKVIIDREQILQTLEIMQDRLPEEMKTARWMVREQKRFVARTNEQARDVLQKAHKEAERLVSDTNIIAEATEEANILVRNAEGAARRIRLEAEDYTDDRLERLEAVLVRVLDQVRSMRIELHQARPDGH